jgi:hypothetical protein
MRARNLRRAQREVWKLAGRNPADWATRQPEKRRFTKTQDWLLKGLGGMLLLIWGLLVGVLTLIWQAGGLGQ